MTQNRDNVAGSVSAENGTTPTVIVNSANTTTFRSNGSIFSLVWPNCTRVECESKNEFSNVTGGVSQIVKRAIVESDQEPWKILEIPYRGNLL